jgi:hypothetical protein
MISRLSRLLLLLLLCIASSADSFAQTSSGNIQGLVEDGSGGALPNAEVNLVQVATGFTRAAHTNEVGLFNAPVVPPGEYAITVTSPGFATQRLTSINLLVDQTLNLHIVMKVGAVGSSVEVISSEPLIDSATSSLGQVIENKQILDMPLNGRNPFALGLLAGNTTPLFGV